MKHLILTLSFALVALCAAGQTSNTIVQSGKTIINLDSNRIAYVLSRTKNAAVKTALSNGVKTVRNNDMADVIVCILKGRRN